MEDSTVNDQWLPEVFGAVLGVMADRAFIKYKRWRSATLFRGAWAFLREPTTIIIPLVPASPVLGSAGVGDLLAMSIVVRLSETHFHDRKEAEIVKVVNGMFYDSPNHIVVIGGGAFNPVFRSLVDELRVPMHFFDTETESFEVIRTADWRVHYQPKRDANGNLLIDTGIAVRARRKNGRYVVIAAGSNTYGSEAAMKYLTTEDFLRALPLGQNVEVVVEANVRDHTVYDVRAVSAIETW